MSLSAGWLLLQLAYKDLCCYPTNYRLPNFPRILHIVHRSARWYFAPLLKYERIICLFDAKHIAQSSATFSGSSAIISVWIIKYVRYVSTCSQETLNVKKVVGVLIMINAYIIFVGVKNVV